MPSKKAKPLSDGFRERQFQSMLEQYGYSEFQRHSDGTRLIPKVPGDPWEYFPQSFSDAHIIVTLQMMKKAYDRGQENKLKEIREALGFKE